MTAYSQNAWPANDRSVIAQYSLPGGRIALRAGDVSVVLLWVANRFHELVEPLEWPGNWGYAERAIRGSSTTLSNHASGTAIDLNAPRHPLGVAASRTFTPAQITQIHKIVDACDGVVRWGGDYDNQARGGHAGSRPDAMHFELVAGGAAVRAVADKIRGSLSAVTTYPTGSSGARSLEEETDVLLDPAPNGRSVTLVVPAGATELVISLGWTSMRVDSVAFFGPTPAQGVNQRWRSQAAKVIDPARPWQIAVPPGSVTAEVNYALAPHPGIEVFGVAAFRTAA